MHQMTFERLPIIKTSELVERHIKQAIANGELKPGDKLPVEKQMAQQFGISIVTLREGLKALQILGLIEKKKGHGGGVFVSEINNKSIKDFLEYYLGFQDLLPQHLYEVRKIIEPSAVRIAAQKITDNELTQLEENVLYCEKRLAKIGPVIDKEDFFDLDSRNNTFHQLIVNATHNPILSLTIDYIFDFLKNIETIHLLPDFKYTSENIRDHRNILTHLKSRDAKKCEQDMISHLGRLDKYLTLRSSKEEPHGTVSKPERIGFTCLPSGEP